MGKIDNILKDLANECWVFEAWSEHPGGEPYYTVKLTCGVQARGRHKQDGKTLEEALAKAHAYIINKWGS